MVTSYYIMRMAEKKTKIDINAYYQSLLDNNYHDERSLKNFKGVFGDDEDDRCRVCLARNGAKIYGRRNTKEIIDALHVFGVLLSEGDDYPKRLCIVCFKFLDTAIMFKHIVRQSEQILRPHFKEEPIIEDQTFENSNHYSTNNDFDYDSSQNDDAKPSNNEKGKKVKKNKKEGLNPKVTCQVCNKVINRSYYKEHLTMHDPNHQKYICDVCGKSFRLRCAYHNHSLRHRSDFPYKCQICPYRGRYLELLKTHVRTHSRDYRYMCTECPARFLFKSNLNSHMLKHKEPQYKCNNCKRAFHTKLLLERHFQADHLGIKNHVCNLCGKAFGYRNAMMKHQIHVHKREKFMFGRMPSYLQAGHKVQETDSKLLQYTRVGSMTS